VSGSHRFCSSCPNGLTVETVCREFSDLKRRKVALHSVTLLTD
jgi:hypothetical protein